MIDTRAPIAALGGAAPTVPTCGLYVQTFGGFCLYRDGRPVPSTVWRRHVAKILLVRLLLAGGQPIPKVRLLGALWPDAAEDAAANRLRVALHALRRILEPDLQPHQPSRFLIATRYECRLADDPDLRWDGGALQAAVEAAGTADGPEQEIALLDAGLAAVHGEWLPEFDGCGELAPLRWHWNGLAVGAAMRLAELALECGRPPLARWAAECAMAVDPGAERAYAVLLAAVAAAGVPGQVRRAYDYACARLRECMDAEPGPVLRRAAADALSVAARRASGRSRRHW